MTEEIKNIRGYEGRYTISNLGIVRSLITNKVLNPGITKFGYARINLRDENNKSKSFFVHRLVAMNFLQNPNNYPEVNHIDCNRLNNRTDNLEWVSKKQNIKHSFLYGKKSNKGRKNPNAKLIEEDIVAIRALNKTGRFSNNQISKLFNISSSSVDNIINNTTWSNN